MGNRDKDKEQSKSGAMGEGADSTWEVHDIHQANRDLNHERDATISRQIVEAVTRETAKVTMQFQALLNEKNMLSLAGSLKITSRVAGFQVMTPLTGPRTKLSIRDGKCGHKKLDMPLKQWKVIQKRLKSYIFITG